MSISIIHYVRTRISLTGAHLQTRTGILCTFKTYNLAMIRRTMSIIRSQLMYQLEE